MSYLVPTFPILPIRRVWNERERPLTPTRIRNRRNGVDRRQGGDRRRLVTLLPAALERRGRNERRADDRRKKGRVYFDDVQRVAGPTAKPTRRPERKGTIVDIYV